MLYVGLYAVGVFEGMPNSARVAMVEGRFGLKKEPGEGGERPGKIF